MNRRIYAYDFEVRKFDWEVVFKNVDNQEDVIGFHNDRKGLYEWIMNNINQIMLVGFNSKGYDDYVLCLILSGYDPYHFSYMLIEEKMTQFNYVNKFVVDTFAFWDLRNAIWTFDLKNASQAGVNAGMALKEYQLYKGEDIVEADVSFKLDRPMTPEELALDLKYCLNDVDSTIRLFHEPASQQQLQIVIAVCEAFELDFGRYANKSNAQLTELILSVDKKEKFGDDHEYIIPEKIDVKNQEVLEFFSKPLDKGETLDITIGRLKLTLGLGGSHGVIPKSQYVPQVQRKKKTILSIDVLSYYPNLIMKYNFMCRNVLHPEKFKEIYDTRVILKRANNPTQAGYKLIINTVSGCLRADFNKLFDPLMGNSMCVTGQLFLLDLSEKLEHLGEIINVNTDGIFIVPHLDELVPEIESIVSEWESRSGLIMEYEWFSHMYQKDVNNYIAITEDGKLKVKGGDVKFYNEKTNAGHPFMNSLYIIQKALVRFFVYGESIEDTIKNPVNVMDYQFAQKRTSIYHRAFWEVDGQEQDIQRVNRVFATTNERYGLVKKVKWVEKDGVKKESYAKATNAPDRCFIYNESVESVVDTKTFLEQVVQIDYDYYINLAKKKLKLWLGAKKYKELVGE